MPAWTAWNCWNGRVPARDRPHPQKRYRPCSWPAARTGSPLWQDHRRRGPSWRVRAQARRLLDEPWGEPEFTVAGHPGWPDVDAADAEAFGLVSVLVTRQERSGRVRLCGWLVDVYCLGQGRGRPTRHGRAPRGRLLRLVLRRLPGQTDRGAAGAGPAAGVRRGRVRAGRGFGPARGFTATTDQLGSWAGPSAISFGRDGKPFFVQGPHDKTDAVLQTLERSVGPGNFTFLVQA
jgi:hypothetical protein